jgi:WD40 repeat protein
LLSQELESRKDVFRVHVTEGLGKALNSLRNKKLGRVSCTALHGQYYFVGNGLGQIKVIDLNDNNKELRQYIDKSLKGVKVTSIDLSPSMQYLAAGYQGGQVAIFDLTSSKLVLIIPDCHDSEVIAVKFYDTTTEQL